MKAAQRIERWRNRPRETDVSEVVVEENAGHDDDSSGASPAEGFPRCDGAICLSIRLTGTDAQLDRGTGRRPLRYRAPGCVIIARSAPVNGRPLAAVRSAEEDIEARLPAWHALSSLFLDTDVTLLREWRATQLSQSPYTVEELETILRDEVFPVCSWNMFSVAGEWAGFDTDWLRSAVLKHLKRRFRQRHEASARATHTPVYGI